MTCFRNVRYNLIGEGWPSFPSSSRNVFIIQTEQNTIFILAFYKLVCKSIRTHLRYEECCLDNPSLSSLSLELDTIESVCSEIRKSCRGGKFKGNDGGSHKWVTFKSSSHIPLFPRSIVRLNFKANRQVLPCYSMDKISKKFRAKLFLWNS